MSYIHYLNRFAHRCLTKNIYATEHRLITTLDDAKQKNIYRSNRVNQAQVSRLFSSLTFSHLSELKIHSSHHSNSEFIDDNMSKRFSFKYHKRRREKNNNSSSSDNQNYDNTFPFAILGLAGLVKSFIQLDEDDQRLRDEERFNKMTPIEKLIVTGVSKMLELKYLEANELFHDALRLAQEQKDEDREFLILTLLATSYFENDDLEKAEKLFIDLIQKSLEKDSRQESPALLELSLKLAAIYSKNPNTHDKAVIGFRFVIDALTKNLHSLLIRLDELRDTQLDSDQKNDLALLGWTYDWYAKHLLSTNNYRDAIYFLKKALELSYVVLGPDHDQTLILLNDIGTTIAMSKSPLEGREYLQKAVDGALQTGSDSLASFCLNLGLTNLKSENYADGKKYCEQSLRIAQHNINLPSAKEIIDLSKLCLNEYEKGSET